MNTKDLSIYNAVANVAADIFKNNMPFLQPGKYAVSDFMKMKKSGRLYFEGLNENELIHFEIDGFSCKFQAGQIFDILADLQTAWGINSGCRANFIKKADAAPVAVAFDVPAFMKTALNAVDNDKNNILNSMKFVGIDTRRRALICTNGKVLTAVAVPDMYINQDAIIKDQHPRANGVICADPILFKTGKGTVKIDVNGNAANGAQTREIFKDYNFPAWETVCTAVAEDAAVLIGAPAFKEIKKAVAAAEKFSTDNVPAVILRAVPGIPEIEIIGFRTGIDYNTADGIKIFKVNLPAPVPFAFTFAINGKNFAAVPAAEKLYFQDNKHAAVFAAANTFSLLMPCDLNKTPWHNENFTAPAGAVSDIFAVCCFSELYADNTPAALASVQDETAAPAAEDALGVEIIETGSENSVFIKFSPDYETPFYLDANGAPVAAEDARAAFEDEETPAYFDNLAAEDEETARAAFAAAKDAPAVQDEETAAPAAEDEETARAAFVEILARGRADQETAAAVAFAAAADSVPAEDETAPAVQDAAPVAVSLPVPVSAVNNWYAVYNSANSLHGVYFSQLLADELLINSLFVPGGTWNVLTVQDPSAAPAEFVPAVASVHDEETAPAVQDEETAAPADSVPAADPVPAFASVFAIMPEIWETAAPAAEDETNGAPADSVPFLDEETPAPFAAEDAPAVAAFYLAADFARRARRVFNVAAALLSLLLITAAPRFIGSVAVQITAPAVQETAQPAPALILDEETNGAPADSVPAAELRNSPETARAAAADSLPADRLKQPRNGRKCARRVNPDNLAPAVAVAADSVRADSVPFVAAADSVPFLETAAPADSVPAVASVAAAEDAPAVQDEETAPAVAVSLPVEDEETAAPAAEDAPETANSAPADSVPAEDAPAPANSPATAVPVAVPGCPGVPAALLLILML